MSQFLCLFPIRSLQIPDMVDLVGQFSFEDSQSLRVTSVCFEAYVLRLQVRDVGFSLR